MLCAEDPIQFAISVHGSMLQGSATGDAKVQNQQGLSAAPGEEQAFWWTFRGTPVAC